MLQVPNWLSLLVPPDLLDTFIIAIVQLSKLRRRLRLINMTRHLLSQVSLRPRRVHINAQMVTLAIVTIATA